MRAIVGLVAIVLAGSVASCQLLQVKPPPLAPGSRECIGMPQATCDAILRASQSDRGAVRIAGYRIRCTVASCLDESGEAVVTLLWADGMVQDFAYSWFGGP
jgi:hypothetical protein